MLLAHHNYILLNNIAEVLYLDPFCVSEHIMGSGAAWNPSGVHGAHTKLN